MARDFGVSRNTAQLAVEQLAAEGLVVARERSGVFVARSVGAMVCAEARSPAGTGALECFDIEGPLTGAFSPRRWADISARQLAGVTPITQALPASQGDPALRVAIARHICPTQGIVCDADQIVITSGPSDSFDILAALAIERGGAGFAAIGWNRRRILHAAMRRGFRTCSLEEAQFTLVSRSPDVFAEGTTRRDPLAWLRKWGARRDRWVLEHGCLFRHSGRESLFSRAVADRRNAAYIGDFHELTGGSLAIGFIVLPKWESHRLHEVLEGRDVPPTIDQRTLSAFIEQGWFAQSVRLANTLAAERREVLVEGLSPLIGRVLTSFTDVPFLLAASVRGDPARLSRRALSEGIMVRTRGELGLAGPERLLFGYLPFSPHHLAEGTRKLVAVLSA